MPVKKYFLILFCFLSFAFAASAQTSYADSILAFQKNYADTHEVVSAEDKKFLSFYSPSESFRINASFKRIKDKKGIEMSTSSGKRKYYFVYGSLSFTIHDTTVVLHIYQSKDLMKNEEYQDYLFVPFGDLSSGIESYGGGRYLDFKMGEIRNKHLLVDFNKAYNPYCAYADGYNCPIPPQENMLKISISAGERNYGKPYH